MSAVTWFTADVGTTFTPYNWIHADTNNNWTDVGTSNDIYQFHFDTGTAASVNPVNIYRWITVDVTWGHPQNPQKKRKEVLKERWGVEELPKLTVEEAREVELSSERFLADVLSPDELAMFRAEDKVRVESGLEPEVHYIVKRARLARIERYVDGKLVETLGFFACWEELPELDALATRVFDLKHNEAMVLEKSCRAAARPS